MSFGPGARISVPEGTPEGTSSTLPTSTGTWGRSAVIAVPDDAAGTSPTLPTSAGTWGRSAVLSVRPVACAFVDTFTRSVSLGDSWGDADTGQTWENAYEPGGTNLNQDHTFSVGSGVGLADTDTGFAYGDGDPVQVVDVGRRARTPFTLQLDFQMHKAAFQVRLVRPGTIPVTLVIDVGIVLPEDGDFYFAASYLNPADGDDLGVATLAYAADTWYRMKLGFTPTTYWLKVWLRDDPEPTSPSLGPETSADSWSLANTYPRYLLNSMWFSFPDMNDVDVDGNHPVWQFDNIQLCGNVPA